MQFTRRFLDSKGRFRRRRGGLAQPRHFTNFYNNLDFGSSASIALIGADGVVRSSGGGDGGFALGQDLKNTGTDALIWPILRFEALFAPTRLPAKTAW